MDNLQVSILKPDFTANLCCWSHFSMLTRVWVIKSVYSTRHHGDCARGKGVQPDCLQPPPSVAGGGGDGGGCCGVSGVFHFPNLVAGKDLNLGERWG